ncbi:MAG: bifunctional riboflavin kinase/FAD synthetase [Lachnospiraceae bacterium]|nr:bifunctional riboflavin kinase/FAD synthetase [Lachnospiraceae bacterium]
MKIIANTTDFYLDTDTAVAIGKFDGVHIGHRRLLEEILLQKSQGLAVCVFTFDPAPAVLFGLSDGKELTTKEEKRHLFEQMGVDILIEFPLTPETAGISPEQFVSEVLVKRMRTRFIAAGEDLSFGCRGAGNAQMLKQLGSELGFDVKIINKITVQNREVSSTYVRDVVERGELVIAEAMLGIPYMIMGKVSHGKRIGRTIGFPTVNLIPDSNKLLPPNGVYYSQVCWQGKQYRAISNVGYKPTVTEEKTVGVESFLYDFEDEIYDENIVVSLLEFRRPEQQFSSLEALQEQLKEDIAAGKIFVKKGL